MKLAVVLILVGLLVPTVAWLVRGDGWDIVVREGYEPGQKLRRIAVALGKEPSEFRIPARTVPLRYLLAASAVSVAAGVFLLVTARSRCASSPDTAP